VRPFVSWGHSLVRPRKKRNTSPCCCLMLNLGVARPPGVHPGALPLPHPCSQMVNRFFYDFGLPAEYFDLNGVEGISSHILSLEGGC
jgi:hypothetical protein